MKAILEIPEKEISFEFDNLTIHQFRMIGTRPDSEIPMIVEKYPIGSCQKIFKKYIDDDMSFHSLRHSCFTNLLESGTNIRTIQSIAGHSSSKTTEIYTHVSKKVLENVVLPI